MSARCDRRCDSAAVARAPAQISPVSRFSARWRFISCTVARCAHLPLGRWHPIRGLAERVAALAPDIALLPVNGRDEARSSNGVPCNFTLDEAVALVRAAGVPSLLAHHYGLFDFNTVAPSLIDERAARETASGGLQMRRARQQNTLRLQR